MTDNTLKKLAKNWNAFIESDNTFQRKVRILQSMWREEKGIPIGRHRPRTADGQQGAGIELGSRIAEKVAKTGLVNYLSKTIQDAVRKEIDETLRAKQDGQENGKLYATPRIYDDLLSSQPLCFNLFAELQADPTLATSIFRTLMPGKIGKVTGISFEHNPRRGDPEFTDDRSAFDVFVDYSTPKGRRGFVGIEVKYHEDLGDKPARLRPRYYALAARMKCFHEQAHLRLRRAPLQQIWRDHLLAGAFLDAKEYAEGLFVFLYPAGNQHCRKAVRDYRGSLTDSSTFEAWTLEEFVSVLAHLTEKAWVGELHERYLGFHRLHQR